MSVRTILVRAEIPVLGMRRGATAELADSPYLRLVLGHGFLTRLRKADGDEPEPLSDAAQLPAAERAAEAEHAAQAAEQAAAAAEQAAGG